MTFVVCILLLDNDIQSVSVLMSAAATPNVFDHIWLERMVLQRRNYVHEDSKVSAMR